MSDSFREFVLDSLKEMGPVVCRAMFGGHGLSMDRRFFGILHKGRLYFKVSAASKKTYIDAGAEPFSPTRKQTLASFFEVPLEILENPPRLVEWAREAVHAASLPRGSNSREPRHRPH